MEWGSFIGFIYRKQKHERHFYFHRNHIRQKQLCKNRNDHRNFYRTAYGSHLRNKIDLFGKHFNAHRVGCKHVFLEQFGIGTHESCFTICHHKLCCYRQFIGMHQQRGGHCVGKQMHRYRRIYGQYWIHDLPQPVKGKIFCNALAADRKTPGH